MKLKRELSIKRQATKKNHRKPKSTTGSDLFIVTFSKLPLV